MKIRPHRGTLAEAMWEVREIEPTEKAVRNFFYILYGEAPYMEGKLKVEPYGYDARIDWNAHIITVNESAIGFTDGPLEDLRNPLEVWAKAKAAAFIKIWKTKCDKIVLNALTNQNK